MANSQHPILVIPPPESQLTEQCSTHRTYNALSHTHLGLVSVYYNIRSSTGHFPDLKHNLFSNITGWLAHSLSCGSNHMWLHSEFTGSWNPLLKLRAAFQDTSVAWEVSGQRVRQPAIPDTQEASAQQRQKPLTSTEAESVQAWVCVLLAVCIKSISIVSRHAEE